jgi:hypothetical protein
MIKHLNITLMVKISKYCKKPKNGIPWLRSSKPHYKNIPKSISISSVLSDHFGTDRN